MCRLSLSVECPREGSILAFGVAAVSGVIASETLAHPCVPHLVKGLLAFDRCVLSWLSQAVISSEAEAVQVANIVNLADFALVWWSICAG